jgi:PiT family inorganic phosphate transporter
LFTLNTFARKTNRRNAGHTLCVCAFEFINGFHETANAVATVIYTNSMKPWRAVVLSGILNGLGVFVGGTAVAMGIINMLPVETLVDQNTVHSLGMVAAILLTAIFWNLGNWLLSIPASSSHTLVGSILGVGIACSLLPGTGEAAVNWQKAGDGFAESYRGRSWVGTVTAYRCT